MKFEFSQHQTPQKRKSLIPPKQCFSSLQSPSKEDVLKKIRAIYNSEFEEEFPTILIQTQDEFLNTVFSFSLQKIRDIFLPSQFCHKSMKDMIQKEENQIRTIYLDKYKLLSTALNDYEANNSMLLKYSKHLSIKNNERFSFLKHFRKHCPFTESVAKHSCHNKNSKFLEVTEENPDSKEEVLTHVICINCKKCYPIECMMLYCTFCECDYYSSLLASGDKSDILPATWKKYHCGSMVNEMMKCIKCREILYLNCKSLMLMCLNKKCNFVSEQHSITWKCALCKKDFNSDAKIYNPMEFNVMKKVIRNALIIKQKAFPNSLKCCKAAPNNLTFYHKKECSGILYQGVYNKLSIIVCEKCTAINFFSKFIWTCPLCDKRFKNDAVSIKSEEDYNPNNIMRNSQSAVDKKKNYLYMNTETEADRSYGLKKNFHYDTLVDILDARNPGLKQTMISSREKRHRITKSSEFQKYSSVCNTESRLENEFMPKRVCINLLESFNYVGKIYEGPLLYELECLKKDQNKQFSGTDRHQKLKNNVLFNISNRTITNNEENTITETIKENEKYKDNSANKSKSIITTENKNEKSLDSIRSLSTIPLFDMDTFSIIKSIGEGSYGKIYLVECPNTKLRFALKKIIAHNIDEAKAVQKEFELMYCAPHDNIMKIFKIQYKLLDFSTYSIYVLMELAESDWNAEIKSRSSRYRHYKETELISIMKQLCKSLAFLQRKSISHRDIKPQNILLYKQSIIKVADFGEAKEIKKVKQECTLRGTELYMSPILYEGLKKNKEDVVHNPYKSDVFSLGYCVLHASTLNAVMISELREVTNMKKYKEIIEKNLKYRYSPKFQSLLLQMLEIDEQKRIDFIELENQLSINFESK